MRFSLWLLPIAATYSLVIGDNAGSPYLNLDGSSNVVAPDGPRDPTSSNGELIADTESITGLIWNFVGAPVVEAGVSGLSSVLDAINWQFVAASKVAQELFHHQPQTEEEKAEYLKKEIEIVQTKGCRAANWGQVVCALGGVEFQLAPDLWHFAYNVYPIAFEQCNGHGPAYCCAKREQQADLYGNFNTQEMGIYCVGGLIVDVI